MGEYSEAEKLLAQRVAEQEKNHPEWSYGSSMQQQFDFTTQEDVAGEIAGQIESLSQSQLKLLKKQIECFAKDTRKEKERESRRWFENAVVPILKDYAERAEACMEITNEDERVISATFRNKSGYELAESDRHMRTLVGLSNHISIEKDEDAIILVLAFDCLDLR